jgi:hypothetical protein
MKLLILQSSPVSRHFLSLRSKYSFQPPLFIARMRSIIFRLLWNRKRWATGWTIGF